MAVKKIDQPQRVPDSVSDNSTKLAEIGYFQYTDEQAAIKQPRGAGSDNTDSGKFVSEGTRSIFNDYHVLCLNKNNYPLFDNEYYKIADAIEARDAIDLIKNPQGASIYQARDFMLCSRYGLPINRMITLRRFAYPVADNIFDVKSQPEPDVSRLITYFDDQINPLSEVLKQTWGFNWRTLQAATESAGTMIGDNQSGVNGWMGNVAKFLDGGQSSLNEVRKYSNQVDPLQDSNKIHGPVDVIAETNVRDIGLKHDFNIQLTFDYELKSINGMNPKALFIDCISNVLATTYNNGRFWGGARYWVGDRPSDWQQKFKWMNARDANDFLEKGSVALKGFLAEFGKDPGGTAIEILKTVIKNGMNLALGKILDTVGRPGIIVMNSLLRNDPVGEWHLTIGNPLNPIMTMGNLIIENTEIEFGDELGYDDFPTKFKVIITLKPGMPRDKAGIESCYNRGLGRTYWAPETIMKTQSNFGQYDASAIEVAKDNIYEFVKDASGNSGISVETANVDSNKTEPVNSNSLSGRISNFGKSGSMKPQSENKKSMEFG